MLMKQGIILRMRKLALIGKGIQHSKSPELYRELISPSIQYDLLDLLDENEIPRAADLFQSYDGINITSPYKKHFLKEVTLTPNALELGAINCLRKKDGIIIGENTDFLAIVDILSDLQKQYNHLEVVLLGDGVMSKVTEVALKRLKISYVIFSRRKTEHLDQLNLVALFSNKKGTPLIINTCAREFVFIGNLPKNSLFWDYNYDFSPHSSSIPQKVHQYFDGLSMLKRQAEYAVAFWSEA
jgi:shikimate dehydrogenase